MMKDIHQILKQYWGYSSFRPLQEDIIQSVLDQKDVLALLPTSGGKSICFQVPAIAQEGIAVVISPLIALMEDQVHNLKKRDIPAIALSGSMSFREMDIALENVVNGKYKFLYLSPERLQNELVIERLMRAKVNLIAIDEAHCISQWGYDFRPSYLNISSIRETLQSAPILALTATATPKVVDDIQEKLGFDKANVLQKSFHRPNLHYNILKTEKKWNKTLQILSKVKGSGIIYSRNRRHTVEVATWLQQNQISADYYHAGLSHEERRIKQEKWLNGDIRIMVCTSAFGMGIDKPDVRLVLHLELPDSLESYFQEAGRAGRDELTAYSIIIVDPSDVKLLKDRFLSNFPDLNFIKRVYQALGNYLQLAIGSGENESFAFDILEFSKNYDLNRGKTFQALKILERDGLLNLNDGIKQSSKVLIKAGRETLYDYQLRNPKMDLLIKVLVRSYGGLDVEYTAINENLLAQRLNTSFKNICLGLKNLHQNGLIDYIPNLGKPLLSFLSPRQKTEYLKISDQNLKDRKKDLEQRISSVIEYVENESKCRSLKLLEYFGEEKGLPCGNCDVCRSTTENSYNKEEIVDRIQNYLRLKGYSSIEELCSVLTLSEKELFSALRWLLDASLIKQENDRIILIQKQ